MARTDLPEVHLFLPQMRMPLATIVERAQAAEAAGFEVRLRLEPTRNNQALRVRYAQDYRLDAWASALARARSAA